MQRGFVAALGLNGGGGGGARGCAYMCVQGMRGGGGQGMRGEGTDWHSPVHPGARQIKSTGRGNEEKENLSEDPPQTAAQTVHMQSRPCPKTHLKRCTCKTGSSPKIDASLATVWLQSGYSALSCTLEVSSLP